MGGRVWRSLGMDCIQIDGGVWDGKKMIGEWKFGVDLDGHRSAGSIVQNLLIVLVENWYASR